MDEIKKFVEDLGIKALENNIKIASIAILSDSGDLVIQTENWDLTNQTENILKVIKGDQSFLFNDYNFSVTETNTNGIIGSNDKGMGYVIIVPFQGGSLVSYAMPQADPLKALVFLKTYAMKLDGKL